MAPCTRGVLGPSLTPTRKTMSNPVAINTGANWKNVNNWHWIEKDCTAWAHDRIKTLLTSSLEGPLTITKITSVEGDVSVNQRKGRVKQLFDLEISFEYSEVAGNGSGTGFISDFTADYEDPSDLNLKLTPGKPADVKDAMLEAIGKVVEEFKRELFEIHGKPLLLEANNSNTDKNENNLTEVKSANPSSKPNTDFTSTTNVSSTPVTSPSTTATTTTTTATTTTTTTTVIIDEVTFPCPPDQLYLMLTDPARIRSWSRSSASLPQILLPQAPFSLFDGSISGKFLTLKAPSLIEMEWKLKSWTQASQVTIEISAEDSQSILKMKQINVPSGEAEVIKSNWHNYYWNPIKRAFGVML